MSPIQEPIEAVLFDLGSTLIYFSARWPDILPESDAELLRQLRAAGLDIDSTFVKKYRDRLEEYFAQRDTEFIEYTSTYFLKTLLAEYGYWQVPEEVLHRLLAGMYAVTQAYWMAEVDAAPTLKTLRERGYRLGLISNAIDDPDVQTLIDKAGLRTFFEVILTSAAAGIRKPNPRIFHRVLERLGIRPERAVMVGDTLGADILGSQNAGIFSIWITRRADSSANRDHLDTIQPDAVVQTLSEIPDLLEELNRAHLQD